ncbi:NADH dehydrogenase [ubiquinone] 1 alpha subcomplex subunit 11-like [Actinia tenebrosa]|uniref:NADH dehydrogenase [ubiquinone] 1 alpha subcomplex subunit 11 n=1 Tax=Actinia tenebrosa TaxID=6105 RepID=A0A6P8HWZ3_ACTTE|nr:NADH dehydrogenase [ubiquinone] 1 alpha subcomplex subunit 11-like [Actinia tenebrosa]
MAKRHDLRIKEFDGEHILERTASFGARGALVGAFYGACAAALTPPKPAPTPLILQALNTMKNTTLLIGGAAAIFAGTTSTVAAIRGVDDPKNWAAGGAATGVFIGLNRRSWGIGTGAMVGLAVAAAVAKYTGVYKHPFREDRVYV